MSIDRIVLNCPCGGRLNFTAGYYAYAVEQVLKFYADHEKCVPPAVSNADLAHILAAVKSVCE